MLFAFNECIMKKQIGDICEVANECLSNRCDSNAKMCGEMEGQACEDDFDCMSSILYCGGDQPKMCSVKKSKSDGEACKDLNECSSLRCSEGKCNVLVPS